MNNKKKHFFAWLLVGVAVTGSCNKRNASETNNLISTTVDSGLETGSVANNLSKIVANGRLEPQGGVIPIVTKPGDRIEKFEAVVGKDYPQGFTLAQLASIPLLRAELSVAEAQLAEASAQKDAEMKAADAKLAVVQQGIDANEQKLEEAKSRLESAESSGGEFDLLRSKIALAKEALEKLEQAAEPGPAGRSLATQSQIKQQELAVKAAEYELTQARREAADAVKVAELMLAASKKEKEAAEATKLAAAAAVPLGSAQKKIELLQSQIEASELKMPINGTVLSIDAYQGQPTSTMPIMQVANLENMVCRAEVPVEDRSLIAIGDQAVIRGGGLESEITGKVSEISLLVGSPKMTSLNPMDPVDYRMAPVTIKIDAQHLGAAKKLVNSQVKVEIDLKQKSTSNSKADDRSEKN